MTAAVDSAHLLGFISVAMIRAYPVNKKISHFVAHRETAF